MLSTDLEVTERRVLGRESDLVSIILREHDVGDRLEHKLAEGAHATDLAEGLHFDFSIADKDAFLLEDIINVRTDEQLFSNRPRLIEEDNE